MGPKAQLFCAIRNTTIALLLFIGATLLTPVTIQARTLHVTIEDVHGPIKMTGCRIGYVGGVLRADVDFRNDGTKTASAVRFAFRATDAFGYPYPTNTPDRLGSFAPDVDIQNSSGVVATGVPANIDSVVCKVEMVRFEDGSEWRAVDVQPTLYYPPTPSPTTSP